MKNKITAILACGAAVCSIHFPARSLQSSTEVYWI